MKKRLQFILAGFMVLAAANADAQRYLEEVFTDAEITVVPDIVYATNIDFLTSDLTPSMQLNTDIGTLSAIADAGGQYPAEYFDLGDPSTQLKLTNVSLDIYHPDNAVDTETERPVIIYLHTGNFLPPPVNGSMMGTRKDSLAVDLCKGWARRGYVAVSVDYRLGWNPIAVDVQTRRGTLLNAVYRAIQDTKMGVRFLRADAQGDNNYGIDESKITLFGEGSGGYMAVAYATLDDAGTELFLEKFLPNPFDPTVSYVDTSVVGTPDGFGFPNTLNLYRDNGVSADIHMTINCGGALADESWLEAGDVPMVSFHAIRDDFAPFTAGTVIVPTTQEEVVDVHGSNFFIQKANDLGNNDVFANIPDGDVYTDRARSLHGEMFDVSNGATDMVNSTPEGLFTVVQPLQTFLNNISAPWQWWDPSAPLSQFDLGGGITTHMAQLASNPNMSEMQSDAFQDTINGYALPRLMCVYNLDGNPCQVTMNDPCPQPTAVICDNFDDYSLDMIAGQAAHWADWPGGTVSSMVSDQQAFSNSQSLLVSTGGVEDQLLLLGDQSMGVWTAEFMMYVPAGSNGYYNMQNTEATGQWNFDIFFNTGGAGDYQDGQGPNSTFTFPEDQWFNMNHIIDLNNSTVIVELDGTVIHSGPYGGDMIGAINFFSIDATNTYFIDDVIVDGNPNVSVFEHDNTVFTVFPNPTEDVLTISSEKNIESVVVRNILGETVIADMSAINTGVRLDMSPMTEGVYLITIEVDGKFFTERVIKR